MSAVGCNDHLISFNYPSAKHLSSPGTDISFLNCTDQQKCYAFYTVLLLPATANICFFGNMYLHI